jgi:hypothetical protein
MSLSRRCCASPAVADKHSGNTVLTQAAQELDFFVDPHTTAVPVDTQPRRKARRRVCRSLRCEKNAQARPLQPPYRGSRHQAPTAPEADAGNVDPIELDRQWRQWITCADRPPVQSHHMTPVFDDDAMGVDLAQIGPPNDQLTFPAGLDERRPASVAEPNTGRCRRQQDSVLVAPICAQLCDLAPVVMQRLVVLEEDPGSRGKPPEGIS